MRITANKILPVSVVIYFCCSFGFERVQSYCLQNGKSYSVGDIWRVASHRECRQCKCFQGRTIRCLPACKSNARFPLRSLLPHDLPKSTVERVASGIHCTLDGKTHQNGESWIENSAHSRSLNRNQCMECNCKAQVITCAIRRCPALDCRHPVSQPGTCCKTCQERSARPPRESSNRGCLSIGRRFQDDEAWQLYLPSPNVFATCVDCNCKNGREYCRKHPCPPARCSKPVKRPGSCCALCPGQRSSLTTNRESHGIKSSVGNGLFGFLLRTNKDLNQKKPANNKESSSNVDGMPGSTRSPYRKIPDKRKEIGCHFGMNLAYKHNELFYPILNKKTQICTKCACVNSVVNCARIRCPQRYPCRRPIEKKGFCCKVCKDMSDREARNLEAVQMYQTIGCSRAKRNHLQVYRYNNMQSSAAQLSAKYLFDTSHQPNNRQSEIHILQFTNMRINVTRQFLDHEDATRNSLDKNWYYLGAIKEKMFTRLLRLERDLNNCRLAIRCIKKLTSLIGQVKTKAARRRRCRSNQPARSFGRLQK